MEYIKKIFKLSYSTGRTDSTHYYFTPNIDTSYNFKILLTQETCDMGFFDVYNASGATISNNTIYVVTGTTNSSLNELKKSGNPIEFTNRYFTSQTPIINGVNLALSYKYTDNTLNNPILITSLIGLTGVTNYKLTYYVDNITYIEYSGTTYNSVAFSFISSGYSGSDYINSQLIKDESKGNAIQSPLIDSDVFIVRQELSVFESIYNLEYVQNLYDLNTFVSGKYFKIVNNS